MDKKLVVDAIDRAKAGIEKYIAIMARLPNADVEYDPAFRTLFNGFYRIQRRSREWYDEYYSSMHRWRISGSKPTFEAVLDHFHSVLERYEPSFSSKLVASLDPTQPVWDKYVLEYLRIKAPSYRLKQIVKVEEAKLVYGKIQNWYKEFLGSPKGESVVAIFDREVPEHAAKITDLKKVDFVLWQISRVPSVIALENEQCPRL